MATASYSSSSSSSSSSSDSEVDNKLKRKFAVSDLDSDSDENDSDNENSDEKPVKQNVQKGAKLANSTKTKDKSNGIEESDVDVEMDDQEPEEDEDVKVLSHKEQRRLKKKQKLAAREDAEDAGDAELSPNSKKMGPKSKKNEEKAKDKDKDQGALPRRQNSVWVGNLSFRTTPDALRAFFDGVGEVTRVHMPMKSVPGAPKGAKGDNRGFAYVDFATPEAKTIAITLSEKNLDGRRLLIKDGGDFTGRPTPSVATSANVDGDSEPSAGASTGPSTGFTKTAQKILSAQKQPAGPCLFLGNLGFEATDVSIREMFTGHARAWAEMRIKRERERERAKKRRNKGKGKDDDLLGVEEENQSKSEEEEGEEGEKVTVDVGIKKVRMGTFEDSGLCKGFAFVDFTSTAHATAALTNPRNHFLDGRKLVVEYASPDAARRGGYREKGKSAESMRPPKRSGENKYGDRRKRKREDHTGEGGIRDGDDENASARTKKEDEDVVGVPRSRENRQRVDDKSAKHRRPKPGAALALAQREKFAIVPSEGTRQTFE